MPEVCRFAPSTTGSAHPGTLLAGLLAWLDARSRGARFVLRLEDLDPERCQPVFATQMLEDLRWFGLDWDLLEQQSRHAVGHQAALLQLVHAGRVYRCNCSRAQIKAHGLPGADGGYAYPNLCRPNVVTPTNFAAPGVLRVRLDEGEISAQDESGQSLSQNPSTALGDPVVRRRDGAFAYNFAVVVDDGRIGVTRVVRGRDIAPSTATQVILQRLLALPTPTYRHHLLLLEERGDKLAKLHGAIGVRALRAQYTAAELCGVLAQGAGLNPEGKPLMPRALLAGFAWERVPSFDQTLRVEGGRLYWR